jgi:hypothetical protein
LEGERRKGIMKKQHIIFKGDGGDKTLKGTIHFGGPKNTSDYTLCGVTLDFDIKTAGDWDLTHKPVNCRRCSDYVKLCKSYKLSEITKGKLRD